MAKKVLGYIEETHYKQTTYICAMLFLSLTTIILFYLIEGTKHIATQLFTVLGAELCGIMWVASLVYLVVSDSKKTYTKKIPIYKNGKKFKEKE